MSPSLLTILPSVGGSSVRAAKRDVSPNAKYKNPAPYGNTRRTWVEWGSGLADVLFFALGGRVMSNGNSYQDDAISRLAAQSEVIGRLAQDAGGFAAVVAAFEAKDPNAFSWTLERLEILPHCELICEWVRTKIGVLRCREVCGPPREGVETPDLRQFARAVVRLADNERLLRRVVDAVSCGNGDDYRAAVAELDLTDYCYLLCHWVYSIIYRRVCEVVCSPQPVPLPDPVTDIRTAARVLASVIANEQALNAIGRAAVALDSETLQSVIADAGLTSDCEIICRVICSWRCVWVCRELCALSTPVLTGAYGIEEARNFALAARQLASQPRALGDLVSAVQNRDAKTYGEIITRFGLGPYCLQVCAWVCSETCSEFCIRVCPPSAPPAEFTNIGNLQFETAADPIGQIDSILPATGLTVGGTQAFYGTLLLKGFLPQTLDGQPLEYSFWYQPITMASTTLSAMIAAGDLSLTVASSSGFPTSGSFNVVIGSANGGYEIMTVTGVSGASGTNWAVTRGQQGTTAAAAAAGATIVTGAAAAGSWTQVPLTMIANTDLGPMATLVATPFLHWEYPHVYVTPNPGQLGALVTADGWIQVPQGGVDFQSNGNMINLVTTMLPSISPTADETGVTASNPANHPLPTNSYFGIQMLVRQAGSAMDSPGGTCSVVAINNTLYNNVNRHPEWDGGVVSSNYGFAMVDIKELNVSTTLVSSITVTDPSIIVASNTGFPTSGSFNVEIGHEIMTVTSVSGTTWNVERGQQGTTAAAALAGATVLPASCVGITDSLTVLFTASCPNLGPVSIDMIGPGGPYSFTLPTPLPETGDWYGTAANDFLLANLTPCAYLITLSASLLLTTGLPNSTPGPLYDQIAFCLT
jgi:hypothetical protein